MPLSMLDMHKMARRAALEYGFSIQFSVNVIKDAKFLEDQVLLHQPSSKLEDLRGLLWSSIDNHDSRDLDQIEFCERGANKEIKVLVAVADVDIFVPKGSLIDRAAYINATSVYTGVETFMMLPERLSADLCSLVEGKDRLAIVIEYFVRKNGSIRQSRVFRALVRNKAKLVYESVGEWLEGKGPIPEKVESTPELIEQLKLQEEATDRLRKFRIENGALELETIEAAMVFEHGKIKDLIVKHKNPARYIIENFMIAANATMVWFLERNKSPMIQRVVRTPERWEKIVHLAKELGTNLTRKPDPIVLTNFLIRQREKAPDQFPDLSLMIVKLLGSGEYVMAEPGAHKLGHFGLAILDYTHSTAPNRRYVDLVIQRLLKACLDKKKVPYTVRQLNDIAVWCTDRSQSARKVERFMRKVAGAFILEGRIGEEFEGIVTGATDKGTYVRLFKPPVEGRVVRNFDMMDVGQKVRVLLRGMDPLRGHIDFVGVGVEANSKLATPGSKRKSYEK